MAIEQGGFSQGIGRWVGTAEIFSGEGRFLGNGADTRHVQQLGDGQVRIDVAFVGPFKHAGHYIIEDHQDHRLYQGPANVGYAEALGSGLVDANAYWPALGLSQRLLLMVLPDGNTQLSLALLSRGEHLLYVVVGQNDRVADGAAPPPSLVSGTAYDLAHDPSAGRGVLLLHRTGLWEGELTMLDGERNPIGVAAYRERVVATPGGLTLDIAGGGFAPEPHQLQLVSNGYQAWTPPDQPVAGSYSLSGGRASSGCFYHLVRQVRVWRREVAAHTGDQKAVLHIWYRGGARVGVQYGVLRFGGD